ncbi:MAG: hypothetical protein K2X93_28860 [Candidatus Obscuribacterales bacterium]|nr:hypothetical protein [Candidatus Obscuribacterales bacterium]
MPRVKPKQPQLPDFLPYFKAAAMLYTAMVVVLPLAAFVMSLNNKNSMAENINLLFILMLDLPRAIGGFMPGPGDYILASVAILYLKKWQVSVGLLLAAGLLWVVSWSCPEVVTLVKNVGAQSAFGLVLSCLYAALVAQVLVCSLLLPAVVAKQRNKARWPLLVGLTVALAWIPPVWILLLFLAYRNDKRVAGEETSEDPSSAKPARKVHQNKLKKKKGFKKR